MKTSVFLRAFCLLLSFLLAFICLSCGKKEEKKTEEEKTNELFETKETETLETKEPFVTTEEPPVTTTVPPVTTTEPPVTTTVPPLTTKAPVVTTQKEFNQTFTSCEKKVTAKVEVNLRKIPSMDGEVVGNLKNGEYILCTGESDMGWSRLTYNGQRVFAITTYLVDESGFSTVPTQKFQNVEEQVTAKESVNLRISPSMEAQIAGELVSGQYLTRTGIGDKGWSRLIFNGNEVYAVTSYLTK